MTVVSASTSTTFELPGVTFSTLVTESRGGAQNAVWRVTIAPRTPGQVHQLTRQEIIHLLSGQARAAIGATAQEVRAGDTIVVPPFTDFALETRGDAPVVAIAILPQGGQAIIGDAAPFTPPWAA